MLEMMGCKSKVECNHMWRIAQKKDQLLVNDCTLVQYRLCTCSVAVIPQYASVYPSCGKCWANTYASICLMLAGVGPMTVAMLMNNTVDSAKRALQKQKVSPTLRMGLSLAPLFPYFRHFLRKWFFSVLCLYTALQIDFILHTALVFCFSGRNW